MKQIHHITWEEIRQLASQLDSTAKYYGVPRGGQSVAAFLNPVDTPEEADFIIDDIIDSGATMEKYNALYPDKHFMALINKLDPFCPYRDKWVQFPWEQASEVDVQENVRRIIQAFDPEPNREGLQDTPRRYVKFLREFMSPPEFNFTTFNSEGMDEMVIVKDINFFSLCEHHMAPFFGTAHVAYVPGDKIVGISKLPRTVELYARRLQNQERITQQVAQRLEQELLPKGVAVVLQAQHLCMSMRGVKTHNAQTVTSQMLGVFKNDINCRQEFLKLIAK